MGNRVGFNRQHRRQDAGAPYSGRSRDVFHGRCFLQRTKINRSKATREASYNGDTCGCCPACPQKHTQPQAPAPPPPPAVRPASIPWTAPQTFKADTSFCPPALLPPESVQLGLQSAPPVYELPQCCCMPTMPHRRHQAPMWPVARKAEPRTPERSFNHGQGCGFGNDNVYLMQSPTPAYRKPQITCKQSPPMCRRPAAAPKLCGSPGARPQGRCFSNGTGRNNGLSGGRKCHPDAYPVPVLAREIVMDPLGPRCDFGEAPEEATGTDACPPSVPPNESLRSLQPVGEALNEAIDEPCDRYYHHLGPSRRAPTMDPIANFEMDRFDRDQRGGVARRRNVSIRTAIDYDYEPISGHENPPRPRHYPENPPAKKGCAPRSQPPPGQNISCASDETAQPNGLYFRNQPHPAITANFGRRRNVTARRCIDYEEGPEPIPQFRPLARPTESEYFKCPFR
ncbi:uncharacterized protein DMAD_08682 [Drosophila madeirensis]|uniref:Uncharacterized protein n=1 Tax=Drosophila madeirensis TaxID=30013 RepID=A0AAU9ESZ1_DROMD